MRPFFLCYFFSDSISWVFPWAALGLDSPAYTSYVAGITAVSPHLVLICIDVIIVFLSYRFLPPFSLKKTPSSTQSKCVEVLTSVLYLQVPWLLHLLTGELILVLSSLRFLKCFVSIWSHAHVRLCCPHCNQERQKPVKRSEVSQSHLSYPLCECPFSFLLPPLVLPSLTASWTLHLNAFIV